ncbi:MAG TPA: radical SAM protein, partial [Actinopolymorphaceae bacterium]
LLSALAGQVGDSPADLSRLADVNGLTYRDGDRLVTTPDRERIADLDTIPSPFLTGLFDSFAAGPSTAALLESNRGCPYGCTFCDWGSATLSRIRKFDMDRVMAEIEWCAKREFKIISLCDANFGIFERDVEIAEKFAEMKRLYGFPHVVGNNYAKNTVKHLKKIIKIFADAGIVAEGIVSLQSMDTQTLQVIRRKNIKVEKYTDLAAEFGANRLPLAADLMMALPGSTTASFRRDLQACADRDVRTRIHPTTMLTNSPMNEPSYREEHGLVAKPSEFVKRSNTFDEADWDYMWDLRRVFLLCDLYSTLRHVARYVRGETGMEEVAFYDQIMRDAFADPERWPTIAFTFQSVPDLMAPPCSWSLFIDEVGTYLTSVIGLPDDAATKTVLDVQLAHLPSRERVFPEVIELPHDYAAWHRARSAEYAAGNVSGWRERVPPLRSFGPGTMTIDDPEGICRTAIGGDVTLFGVRSSAWDLDSPVCRPRTILRQPDEAAEGPDATNGNGSTSTVEPGHAQVAGDIGTPVDFGGVAVADPASLEQSTTPQWVRQSSD